MKSIIDRINAFRNDYSKLSTSYSKEYAEPLNTAPLENLSAHLGYKVGAKVSIIIPSWNSEKSILYTLRSIERSNICRNYKDMLEVIVVDDGSDISINEYLIHDTFAFDLIIIRQKHSGRAYAIDNGVVHSSGRILVFLDADVILYPYALDEIIKRQLCFLDNAITFGFRENRKEEIDLDCLDSWLMEQVPAFWLDNRFTFDTSESWGSNMMLETRLLQNRSGKCNMWMSDGNKPAEYCWQFYRMVYGFLFSVSKEVFYKVGGFDSCMNGWGWEDSCFIAKCTSLNIPIIPVPSACVIHIDHADRSSTKEIEGERNFCKMTEILSQTQLPSWNPSNYVIEDKAIKAAVDKLNSFDSLNYSAILPYIEKNSILYYYRLGLFKEAVKAYYARGICTSEEARAVVDCSIKLNNKQLFTEIVASQSQIIDSLYISRVAYFYFDIECQKEESFAKEADVNMQYCFKFSAEQHLERANLYFNEKQYYLAMLDYFAVYLVTKHESEQLGLCKRKLKEMKNCLYQFKREEEKL